MKQIKLLIASVAAVSAAFADSSLTWTTDQTGGLVLDGNVTITVPSGTSVTCSGVISGSGKLIKEGAGSLTLSADNSYSGGTQVNEGKLIGTSDNPFGNDHANNPIYVNTNLTDGRNTSTDTSTAVIFAKAGTSASAPQTYGYPITCSAWSNHGARPGSYNNVGRGSSTLYNIALGADYIKLTGDITGGDISIRCGTIGSGWGANPALKSSPATSPRSAARWPSRHERRNSRSPASSRSGRSTIRSPKTIRRPRNCRTLATRLDGSTVAVAIPVARSPRRRPA